MSGLIESCVKNRKRRIELLAPAANADVAFAAIRAGADSVYMGGPAFGARAKVGNPMSEVGKVASYAHRYGARCFMTLNTLVFENEMEDALRIARQAYESGVDALIIQDLGLIEAGLPPIELHASTQCHIATAEKARFLEQAGFKRLVLARELSVQEIARIASSVDCEIECFVHGALCVSYSGQCYMGCYLNGRSGNRGECSQACRLSYDLVDARGTILEKERYLLSMKDLNAEAFLPDLLRAGVTCLKIEGRLKDAQYVKNVTAYYRRKLDELFRIEGDCVPFSQGEVRPGFEPDLEKGFHRAYTSFNLDGERKEWVVPETPKAIGEDIGSVLGCKAVSQGYSGLCLYVRLMPGVSLLPGDGLCYFDSGRVLKGSVLERVELNASGKMKAGEALLFTSWSGKAGDLPAKGTRLFRNRDTGFERSVQDASCERKIGVHFVFDAKQESFRMRSEDGLEVSFPIDKSVLEEAAQPAMAKETFARQLAKLGGTAYEMKSFSYEGTPVYFLPSAVLNDCRRHLAEKMDACRERFFDPRENHSLFRGPASGKLSLADPKSFPIDALLPMYRWNVANSWAERFYRRRGVDLRVSAFELQEPAERRRGGQLLMVCKHCVRYQIGRCLKDEADKTRIQDLYLCHGRDKFALRFDCKNCRMEVWSI